MPWIKMGRSFYTLSNAYTRQTTKGSTKHVPVADDYKKMFDMCDKYNKQIKNVCGLSNRVARII